MASIQLTTGLAQGIKNVLQQHPELRSGITIQGAVMEVRDEALPVLSQFLRSLPGGAGKSGVLGKVADVVDKAMSTAITRGTLAADQVMGIPAGGAEALQSARILAGAPASPVNLPAMNSALGAPSAASPLASVADAAVATGAASPSEAAVQLGKNVIPGTEAFMPRSLGAATEAAIPLAQRGATIAAATQAAEQSALSQLAGREFGALRGGKLTGKLAWGPNRALSAGEQAAKSILTSGGTVDEALAAGQAARGLPAWLAPGSAGRGLGYGLAGQVASSGLRSILGGERDASTFLGQTGQWDNAAEDALSYAGAGAGIGSMIAPGIGTAIGGILGGGAGFIKGWLGGEDSQPKQIRDYITKLSDPQSSTSLYTRLTAAGIDMGTANQILQQIAAASTVAKSKKEVESIVQSVIPQIGAIGQQQTLYNNSLAQQQANQRYVQQYLMPTYNNSLNAMTSDAKSWAAAQQAAAAGFSNKDLGKLYAANALAAPVQASRLASSMTGQLAALQMMQPQQPQGFYPDIFNGTTGVMPQTGTIPAASQINMGILAGVNG